MAIQLKHHHESAPSRLKLQLQLYLNTMTLLTMNAAIVAAIEEYEKISGSDKDSQRIHLNEPSLYNPKIGNPISHQQLIALHDILGSHYPIDGNTINLYRLDQLLRGSRIYTQPKVKEAAKVVSYKPFTTLLHI